MKLFNIVEPDVCFIGRLTNGRSIWMRVVAVETPSAIIVDAVIWGLVAIKTPAARVVSGVDIWRRYGAGKTPPAEAHSSWFFIIGGEVVVSVEGLSPDVSGIVVD